jgi:hypothetical protein
MAWHGVAGTVGDQPAVTVTLRAFAGDVEIRKGK